MKHLATIFALLFFSVLSFSQSKTTDLKDEQIARQKLEVRSGGILKVAGYEISGISNDPTLADSLNSHLVTEAAAKAYANTKDPSTTNELTTFTSASSAPSSPKTGDIWHKSTTDSVFIRTAAPAWAFLAIRASGSSDPAMGGDLSGTASNAQIVANAVGSSEIATGAVTTTEILDATVAWADLAQAVKDSINAGGSSVGGFRFSTNTVSSGTATLDSVVTFLTGTTSAVIFPDGQDGDVRWVVNERNANVSFTVHASDGYQFDDNKFIPANLAVQYVFNSTDNEWKVGNYEPLISTISFTGGYDPVVPFSLKNRDAGDIDVVAGEQMQIDTGAVAYVDLEQAVKDTIGTYWKKTGRVVTSNSDVHVVVADSASISSANTILSASTNIYLNPTGELVLGNGSGSNLPVTNSDHLGLDLGYDGTGVLVGSQKAAKRSLSGSSDPVNGSTVGWYIGQLYTNTTSGDIFVATTASANPDLSGTGSTWVKVSDGGSVTISDTLNAFPVATNITSTEKIVLTDSVINYQDFVDQIVDTMGTCIRKINQTNHGLSEMWAVLDTSTTSTAKYIRGNTSAANRLPTHLVIDVIDANNFVIQRCGYLTYPQTAYTTKRAYYLQDDGSFGATPDATFNYLVFAITSKNSPIYMSLLPGSVSPTTADSLWELSNQTIFGASENVLKLSTARTSGSYNQHLLFGGPTVDLPGTDGTSENEYSRLIYFNQDRAFFLAGRVNSITDIGNSSVKQWDGGRVAQYSASFGWNNYPYGGYSSVNGALGKGQTVGGYNNRSLDAYAQTWGQNNINGSFRGTVLGNENVIGRTMYDFSRYDTTTATAYVKTDVTAQFPVNSLVVSRTYDSANSYYVPAHARVTAVSYSGGTDTTSITFDRKYFNITDYFQSSGQLIRGEPGVGTYSNHARGALNYISGATNVVDGVSNTVSGERNYLTGKSNTVSGNDSHADCSTCEITVNNSWAFGSQVKNDIASSIAYAQGGFSNVRGTAQTFIVPSKLDFTTSGNIDIPMPDSATWTVRADFAMAEYSVGNLQGGFSLFFTCYRDGSGNTTILGSPATTYTAGTPGTWTATVSGSTTNLRISLAVDSGKNIKAYGSVNIQQVID